MEQVEFTRECDVVQIPAGVTVRIEKGTEAFVTQSLGGSFTLQIPSYGGLFRLPGRDADAIGREAPEAADPAAAGDLEAQVWSALKTCYDPEIPVNIVDLGLVYDLTITPQTDGTNAVRVQMTLTAPGCGMGTAIAADAQHKILALGGVSDADVEVVWDPPWNPQMISPEGKERLGMA